MKRLLLLVLVAGGVAFWWKRRQSAPEESWATASFSDSVSATREPPRLGGDVSQELLDILACPVDKQPVKREGNYLVCGTCQRHYPIRDGIPVMLIDEALTPEQAQSATA